MINLEKFKDIKGYDNFVQASRDIMAMAKRMLGDKTFFTTHNTLQTLSVLTVDMNDRAAIPEGLSLPLGDAYWTLVTCGGREPLIIQDTAAHPSTALMPATLQLKIRSYLGVPILLRDGQMFGTLCAVDTIPNIFTEDDLETLVNLARLLSYTLDLELMVLQNQKELQFAQRVQQGVLNPPIQNEEITIEPVYIPTSQVGGDMYAFYPIDEHRYGVCILDVMGKGVSASMVSMSVFSLLEGLMKDVVEPVKVMNVLQNHMIHLYQGDKGGEQVPSYFTAIYAVVDTAAKSIEYVNAGHPSGLFRDAAGNVLELSSTSAPVGLFEGMEFEKATLFYQGPCRLLLYTDGLIELPEQKTIAESIAVMQEKMSRYSDLLPRPFMERLHQEMFEGQEVRDDICMVTVDILQ